MTRHKCKECGKTFDLKRYLTKHDIRMHKNPVKSEDNQRSTEPLKCSMCDKEFPRLSHLQRHQMTHLNVRTYSCSFCEEKFVQKAHLTRHMTRKHSNDSGIEVNWIACDKCGHLFKTTFEMKTHRRTVHELHRCKRCQEVIEAGNDGLRQHVIKCRNEKHLCEKCGASFSRPADLAVHQISCLKKVAFVCTPCNSYFKQRTELDRHIKKLHFRSAKCSQCEYISESPVKHAQHTLDCLKIKICGYCNLENPDKSHVAEVHWQRLKKAISMRVVENQRIQQDNMSRDMPSTSDKLSVDDGISEEFDDNVSCESEEEGPSNSEQDIKEEKHSEERKLIVKEEEEDNLFNFPESSTSHLDFCSTAFREEDDAPEEFLTLSICPKDTDLSFNLRGRLPSQLVALFPELENTSIVLLNSVALSRCRMTVRVPVCIPKSSEKEAEMRKWLRNSIVLEDE